MSTRNPVPDEIEQAWEAMRERRKEVYTLAKDRWPELLAAAGVPEQYRQAKRRKRQPCPLCMDGTDRFTFDDREGDGDYFCRRCGAGKGITFLMKFQGSSWIEAVDWVLERLGDPTIAHLEEKVITLRSQRRGHACSEEQRERRLAKIHALWNEASPVTPGDPVHRYLRRRIEGLRAVPPVIRYHPSVEYFEQVERDGRVKYLSRGWHPVMLSAVTDASDALCDVHRTYLTREGHKAVILGADGAPLDVRKRMPSVQSTSPAIRLAGGRPSCLGVAEGVETALAAALFRGIPTWSLLSTSGIRRFEVPSWVRSLVVFRDNDPPDKNGRRAGFDAAQALASRDDVVQRVRDRTLRVMVRATEREGTDFADLLEGLHRRRAA